LQAQEVITSSGGHGITTSVKVIWTIGEPVTETSIGLNNILTQGFNQGNLLLTTIKKPDLLGTDFKIFPNPASDNLKIIAVGIDYEKLRFVLLDLNGKVLIENVFTGYETDIQIGNLKPSIYFLKIYQNQTELSIYKIIKK
jgi:hypothetical protein